MNAKQLPRIKQLKHNYIPLSPLDYYNLRWPTHDHLSWQQKKTQKKAKKTAKKDSKKDSKNSEKDSEKDSKNDSEKTAEKTAKKNQTTAKNSEKNSKKDSKKPTKFCFNRHVCKIMIHELHSIEPYSCDYLTYDVFQFVLICFYKNRITLDNLLIAEQRTLQMVQNIV